ncbi:hypothetical protein [uncultured Cocleimonas sp.]|uniref:hypothetical protein n=1 Tax=uncultured Cocleimonas sp. TaxID=1051587 RepID=UPI002620897F|nr:hypothetical protein [uncultured Cocleimonas sp.]
MTELKYTKEQINNYDFFQAWKVDDKEWVKARRKQWLEIKNSLDQIAAFDGILKKDYKALKQYFLTGYSEPITQDEMAEWEYNMQPCCLEQSHNRNIWGEGLYTFWLSPDHSPENWERIKCAKIYKFRHNSAKNHPESNESDWFERSCVFLRNTTKYYPKKEAYQTKGSATFKFRFSPYNNCEALFGDELQEFLANVLKVEETDECLPIYLRPHERFFYADFESILIYYLRGDEFNPSNPIRYFVDEYIKWGFDKTTEEFMTPEANLVALAWHVVDTPEGRHPVQLQVANELKQGILDGQDRWSSFTKKSIEEGIAMFESGIAEAFHKKDPDLIKSNNFKFRQKHFGHTF